ncbi:hypothetical protein P3X46_003799 [Hevea brasiliensis]|uniref:Transmembrane protein n=1 Tax=Hevea brasiliensis TaxID=3981 RepID=A0ABQ9NB49_HEVBR|nr:hypothetical protein P3X46_003799 [Hevea brasiliensis]
MKTGKVFYLLSFLSFFLLLFILLSFSLASSISHNRHNLLVSTTYDFIAVGKSSRVSLFFMLSFITITITISLGSSNKPCFAGDFDSFFPSFPLVYETDKMNQVYEDSDVYSDDDDDDDECDHRYDGYEEDNDDDIEQEDVESSDEDENKDLEKSIEEFIAKVKQKWGEELLADRLICWEAA